MLSGDVETKPGPGPDTLGQTHGQKRIRKERNMNTMEINLTPYQSGFSNDKCNAEPYMSSEDSYSNEEYQNTVPKTTAEEDSLLTKVKCLDSSISPCHQNTGMSHTERAESTVSSHLSLHLTVNISSTTDDNVTNDDEGVSEIQQISTPMDTTKPKEVSSGETVVASTNNLNKGSTTQSQSDKNDCRKDDGYQKNLNIGSISNEPESIHSTNDNNTGNSKLQLRSLESTNNTKLKEVAPMETALLSHNLQKTGSAMNSKMPIMKQIGQLFKSKKKTDENVSEPDIDQNENNYTANNYVRSPTDEMIQRNDINDSCQDVYLPAKDNHLVGEANQETKHELMKKEFEKKEDCPAESHRVIVLEDNCQMETALLMTHNQQKTGSAKNSKKQRMSCWSFKKSKRKSDENVSKPVVTTDVDQNDKNYTANNYVELLNNGMKIQRNDVKNSCQYVYLPQKDNHLVGEANQETKHELLKKEFALEDKCQMEHNQQKTGSAKNSKMLALKQSKKNTVENVSEPVVTTNIDQIPSQYLPHRDDHLAEEEKLEYEAKLSAKDECLANSERKREIQGEEKRELKTILQAQNASHEEESSVCKQIMRKMERQNEYVYEINKELKEDTTRLNKETSDMKVKIDDQNEVIENLQVKDKETQAANTKLREKHINDHKKIEQQEVTINDQGKQITELEQKVHECENDKSKLKGEKTDVEAKVKSLGDSLNETKATNDNQNEEIRTLTYNSKNLQTKLDFFEETIKELKKDKINLNKEKSEKQKKIDDQNEVIENLQVKDKETQAANTKLREEHINDEKKKEQQEVKINDQGKQITELEHKVDECEHDKSKLKGEKTDVVAKVKSLEGTVVSLNETKAYLEEQNKQLTTKDGENETTINNLGKINVNFEKKVEEIEDKNSKLKDEICQVKAEITEIRVAKEKFQKRSTDVKVDDQNERAVAALRNIKDAWKVKSPQTENEKMLEIKMKRALVIGMPTTKFPDECKDVANEGRNMDMQHIRKLEPITQTPSIILKNNTQEELEKTLAFILEYIEKQEVHPSCIFIFFMSHSAGNDCIAAHDGSMIDITKILKMFTKLTTKVQKFVFVSYCKPGQGIATPSDEKSVDKSFYIASSCLHDENAVTHNFEGDKWIQLICEQLMDKKTLSPEDKMIEVNRLWEHYCCQRPVKKQTSTFTSGGTKKLQFKYSQ